MCGKIKIRYQKEMKLKKNIKQQRFLLVVITLLTCIPAAFSLYYTVALFRNSSNVSESAPKDYLYHIALIGENSDAAILTRIYKGASEAAESYNAIIDLISPPTNAENTKMSELSRYAGIMGVTGILAYVSNENIDINLSAESAGRNIPIVIMGNDNPESDAVSYIGLNGYELGKKIAAQLQEMVPAGSTVISISDMQYAAELSGRIVSSLQESIGQGLDLNFRNISMKRESRYAAEDRIRDIIRSMPDLQAVVCMSQDDTVRVIDSLVNLNKAGRVAVIGFGDTGSSRKYLEKGILSAIISQEPEEMGRQAVKNLFEYIDTGNTNDYTTINVRMITESDFEKE
jgi:ribose transport system substrate-binding protein